MLSREHQRAALQVVGWITAASGAAQMAAPRLVLWRLSQGPDRLSNHMFATVGMFMAVSGGSLLTSTRLRAPLAKGPLGWCAAQKFGAAAAVGIGVKRRLLSPLALAVAAFDLASGALIVAYRQAPAN